MHRNSKMLLGAMLVSITSACVVPPHGDEQDREALDNDLVIRGGDCPSAFTLLFQSPTLSVRSPAFANSF